MTIHNRMPDGHIWLSYRWTDISLYIYQFCLNVRNCGVSLCDDKAAHRCLKSLLVQVNLITLQHTIAYKITVQMNALICQVAKPNISFHSKTISLSQNKISCSPLQVVTNLEMQNPEFMSIMADHGQYKIIAYVLAMLCHI
jgi:hypothetical protein